MVWKPLLQEHLAAIAQYWTFSISGFRLTVNDLILHYSTCPKLWAQETAVETIVLSSRNVSRAKTGVDRICVPFCCWNKTVPLSRKAARGRVDSTVYELDKKKQQQPCGHHDKINLTILIVYQRRANKIPGIISKNSLSLLCK